MQNKKAYCKGVLCRKTDRKYKSFISGKYMCGMCSVNTKKGFCSIDEYFNPKYNIDWEKIDNEFEEMIQSLKIKKTVKIKNKNKVVG